MENKRYICITWVMVFVLLFQNIAFAEIVQNVKNTAPVANFTVEKNRNVKIMVVSDYTGADSANLKNSITSMKSELTNDAKIDVEYVTPTDINIGTQKGSYKYNAWGMLAHGSYRISGTRRHENFYYYTDVTTNVNESVDVSFSHSPTVGLPEGQEPTIKYNVPVRYTHSKRELKFYPNGNGYSFEDYIFYDNNGTICDGKLSAPLEEYKNYTASADTNLYDITSQPYLTYDDFWSIMYSNDTPITNNVLGWDLSKINYDVTEGTDTYVVFAMNNESTNYYAPYVSNTYHLGQLRNDANLGKYITDSEARVYSICSDNLENVNLSTNPQYPVTFTSTQQNASVKDLITKSFDGRSFGKNNVSGLVSKIKENVKKPTSSNVDMLVATDKDTTSTDSFIASIKNEISSDIDLQTNVVDKTSLEDTPAWTKYVVNGKYRNIITKSRTDVILLLMDNGDLWGMGSNVVGEYNNSLKLGLLGMGTDVKNYPNLVKIATGVKDAKIVSFSNYSTLIVLKKDGTLWLSGLTGVGYYNNKEYIYFNSILVQTTEFGKVSGIFTSYWSANEFFYVINDVGRVYDKFFYSNYYTEDMNAPYHLYEPSSAPLMYRYGDYYVLSDGTVYIKTRYNEYFPYTTYKLGVLPSPIKEFSNQTGLMYCEDNNVYKISNYRQKLNTYPVKQVFLDDSYFVDSNSDVYRYDIDDNGSDRLTKKASNIDKILFMEQYSAGMIVKYIDGKIGIEGGYISKDILFDVSFNNTAADYLQVGVYFSYISKLGELYISTYDYNTGYVFKNYGKFDPILSSTTSTVKAFSKTKIFNTALREGSERYFIYISDTIKQDTYFSTIPDYFLFGNLDSQILNYLNTNNFNIYVITPQQALDLKLQYPYVPVNIQQYSLRDLVTNATKDSSICRDINTVRTLISRKFSAFTKQGSTTLTLIVDEEGMNYNLVYRDFENDPKYADKWRYTHDQTYFDNPNGLASYSGQWLTTPAYSFSKVGKYTVVSQFRDNPKNVASFDPYKLWSNMSAPATIIVHRRPFASFNTQIVSKVGTNVNLSYLDYSYDLDHNITRADKGIATRSWQYRKINTEAWIEGKPTNLVYNSGVYEIRLKCRDIEGAWSKPYIDTIDTANLVPTINATPTSFEGDHAVGITITADDNGENDFHYMRYAVTTSTAAPTASQWVAVTNGIKVKPITIATAGTYYLHMEAYDTAGQVGKNMTGPYTIILNKPPTVTITGVTPNYLYVGDDVTAIFKATDPDLDTLNCTIKIKQGTNTIWSGTKTVSPIGSTYPTVSMLTKQNIPAGNYTLEVTATDPFGLTDSDTYDFIVHDISISNVVISGYWNHWRGQTDIFGKKLTVEPHRFLSLETIKIDVTTVGNPNSVSIRFSPELEAMKYTDQKGNTYDYKNDFFKYYVYFPLGLNTSNKTNWNIEYALPLASSTKGWDDVQIKSPYKMIVTAKKGSVIKTYEVDDLNITGNIYDLTYIQKK